MHYLPPLRNAVLVSTKIFGCCRGQDKRQQSWGSPFALQDMKQERLSCEKSFVWMIGSGPESQNEEQCFYLQFAAVLEIKTTASSNVSSVLRRAKLNKSLALLSDESFTLPAHERDRTTGS